MRKSAQFLFVCAIAAAAIFSGSRAGHSAEIRFALIIGNDTYKAATLPTPANDAGLIADTLQSAGFTVSGARNLDQDTLRRSFREFLERVASAGPDAVALVYIAGVGLQFEGENYFVPVDADIKRDVDIPIQAIRISDFTRPLAALPGRVKIVILDAARQNPFATAGQPLASGLALVDPEPGTAIASNAAPGTIGPNEQGPYGAFAMALSEMIQTGGLGLDELFARVRLRVDEITQGAEVPWYAAQIEGPFEFTVREAGAPALPAAVAFADVGRKPLRSYSAVEDAYAAALERDSLEGYQEFLAAFPDSPFARRIGLMLAARREAMIWRRCVREDSPPAYWSYLRRYPDGPHAFDARRRLHYLSAAMEPPMGFAPVEFGVPPPPPRELGYFNRGVMVFSGPDFGRPPPPPPRFLPPRPREFAALPPPPRPGAAFVLPTPVPAAFPLHVKPPAAVTLPPTQAGQPATPGARPSNPVSLPAAVHANINPSGPGAPPAAPGTPAIAPARLPPGAVRPPGPPSAAPPAPPTAAVKPAPLPVPPHPAPPAAAAIKPGPLPPVPAAPAPAAVKPAPPPPHPAPPAAAAVKPAPPPPRPAPLAPAAVKPAPPPPHPAPPAAAAVKPAPPPPPPAPPAAAAVRPAPPPPHPAPPAPVAVKPAPPPPHPAPPAAAAVKPAPPPPPHPAPPAPAAARPAPPSKPPAKIVCPAGKTAAVENGHEVCK